MELSWLFPLRVLHHLPRAARLRLASLSWLTPRQTASEALFESSSVLLRQFPFRTAHAYFATNLVGSFTPKYCEVFTQPQKLQPHSNFWLEPPNFSFQGTDQFMPFALFTTLLVTCSFESRQPMVIRYNHFTVSVINRQEYTCCCLD
jgi:hypothetical protein